MWEAGLLEEAAGPAADAGRAGEEVLAAARLQARTGADRSRHRGAGADCLRRQRPHVRARAPRLHAGCRRRRHARPRRAHLAARRQEQRRRLRDASRLRRQAGVPALRHAVRRQRHPRQGIERRRGLEVHRHQQRQRRRQEGAVRHRHGPGDERRAPGERPHLGARQLDLQHHQSGPAEVDARRRAARAHRLERRAVGRDHGQLRQDVVPGRRQRHARLLPDARSRTATSPIPNSSRPISTSPGARRC